MDQFLPFIKGISYLLGQRSIPRLKFMARMKEANVTISELRQTPLEEQRIEICERKGLGHPDSICDAVMNEASVGLSKEYLKRFGAVMHHNIDKGLLAAGKVETRLGGGVVEEPMLMVFGDRATFEVGGEFVPVNEIVLETAKKWFRENLRYVDPEEHIRYQVEIRLGAESLVDIFKRRGKYLGANDTSAAVGFAPLTQTENVVLETERFLNSDGFKKEHPESGEDVKVMGLREDRRLTLTVAVAFVDRFVESENDYFRKKDEISEQVRQFVNSKFDLDEIDLHLNTADERGRGVGGMYLTVLGTSADGADCGQVGRGNRVNGIIPLNRPTCSEAAAGKNPVSHVGKIYNLLTYRMADEIYRNVAGIDEVYVWLLSQIGQPINKPRITSAQLILKAGTDLSSISGEVEEIIESLLENIDKFSIDLAYGRIPVC